MVATRGALDGDSQCSMSIFKNGNVTFLCHLFSPMICQFQEQAISLIIIFLPSMSHVTISPTLHIELQKYPCGPVKFRGQGPYSTMSQGETPSFTDSSSPLINPTMMSC